MVDIRAVITSTFSAFVAKLIYASNNLSVICPLIQQIQGMLVKLAFNKAAVSLFLASFGHVSHPSPYLDVACIKADTLNMSKGCDFNFHSHH